MSPYDARAYDHEADCVGIVDVVWAVRPSRFITEYPSVRDIPDLLLLPINQATTRLWSNDHGTLVRFAYVDAFHTLHFDIDWQSHAPALELEILTWAEACLREQHPFFYATSHEADRTRLSLFDHHGFSQRPDTIVQMIRSLENHFPAPPFLLYLRSVRSRAQTYDPTLNLVAAAPDGTRAAHAMGQVGMPEEPQGMSYADLFATHPTYCGRGLAHALMQLLVRRLQAKGYRTATLRTDRDNQSMQRVARAVGFRIMGTTLRFQQPVQGYVVRS